eukprot:TRINITY_DN5379_c0_g1_i1.p1 TRINITY_DN5379_c0_g1~~TRINITY_DN5379_c0_g1_i1.p1  ORF type:complete len:804 (-),score=147.88 TRINITY_DN5379_c0_g1_i1:19-2430(-)
MSQKRRVFPGQPTEVEKARGSPRSGPGTPDFLSPNVEKKVASGPWTPGPQVVKPLSPRHKPPETPVSAADSYITPCPADFIRSSVLSMPMSPAVSKDVQIPLGVVLRPLAPVSIHQCDFGASSIPRCRECKGYINPYVIFSTDGKRWRCSLCGKVNAVTNAYYSPVDHIGRREDLQHRPELVYGAIQFLAGNEARPSPPPVHVFVIEATPTALRSGMLDIAADVILKTLDELVAENANTHVAFITYDSSIHLYHLTEKKPVMMILTDLFDIQVPLGYKFLAPLHAHRAAADKLLSSLSAMFHSQASPINQTPASCMGSALAAAIKITRASGGKILTFSCMPPTVGLGLVSSTYDQAFLNTDKEMKLINPENEYYKNLGIEIQKLHISVDQFFFGTFNNIATLGSLSKLTGGQVYHYPQFQATTDAMEFGNDLRHNLIRPTVYETVLRVRATKGLTPFQYFGNSFLRGVDLLGIPTMDSDKTITVELNVEEDLSKCSTWVKGGGVVIQAALVFTNTQEKRELRILTKRIPISTNLINIFNSADCHVVSSLLAKSAAELTLTQPFKTVQERTLEKVVNLAHAYKKLGLGGPSSTLPLPSSLQGLPLYVLALLKSASLRTFSTVHPDRRVFSNLQISILPTEDLALFLYPRLIKLSELPEDCGVPHPETGNITLPPNLNLNSSSLEFTDGIYLLDTGRSLCLWISKEVGPWVETLFGCNVDEIDWINASLEYDSSLPQDCFANRCCYIIEALRAQKLHYQPLYIVHDSSVRATTMFSAFLVEDKSFSMPSYFEFVQALQLKINSKN